MPHNHKQVQVNWVRLSDKDHRVVRALFYKPQKRMVGKQPQPQVAERHHVEQPQREMVERQHLPGNEIAESSEEVRAVKRGPYRWSSWSPSKVRSYFKRNPGGTRDPCQTCLGCGVSRLLPGRWYMSQKSGRPAGSYCKACKIKRQMEKQRPVDVD